MIEGESPCKIVRSYLLHFGDICKFVIVDNFLYIF